MSALSHQARLLRPAQKDYFEILDYLLEKNPRAAEKFESKFDNLLERLERFPFHGKLPNDETLRLDGYRIAIIDKYLVFYIVKKRIIEIHRIIHGARDYLRLLMG